MCTAGWVEGIEVVRRDRGLAALKRVLSKCVGRCSLCKFAKTRQSLFSRDPEPSPELVATFITPQPGEGAGERELRDARAATNSSGWISPTLRFPATNSPRCG